MQKPFTQLGQRQNLIRQFTPNWFTVSMGTGVVALIVSEFPMLKAFTWQLGTGLWYFNILLFVLFSVLYGLRWAFYPHEAKQIFQHPSMSLFLGTIPMALATIWSAYLWRHSCTDCANALVCRCSLGALGGVGSSFCHVSTSGACFTADDCGVVIADRGL